MKRTGAELGLAFDGDGDRLGVVTRDGNIIYPDRQLMLFATDILPRHPGAHGHLRRQVHAAPGARDPRGRRHAADVEDRALADQGASMKEIGAPLAGEMSGHIFFGERWYGFDDATYTAARLLEILSRARRPERGAQRACPPASARPS